MLTKLILSSRRTAVRNIYRCISSSSAQYQSSEVVKSAGKFEATKVPEKKPQRAPLLKNFSIAKVDAELLGYPEAFIDMEVLNQAKLQRDSYEDFLRTNVYNVDETVNIEKLKEFGSFNCQQTLTTDRLYSTSEPESLKLSYSNFISNHKLVADMINTYCDEQTKQKYLMKMNSGELLGTVCMMEKEPPKIENKQFNTLGTKFDDFWLVDGEKSFVLLNDLESSVLLMAAAIDSTDILGDHADKIGLFLIDGNAKGVSVVETLPTIGYNEAPFKRVTIKFKNVEVPLSCFLSKELSASMNLLSQLRMNVGVHAVAGVMQPMINKLSDYFINTKVQETYYKDLDVLKELLGRITAKCYALESMIYMTAGLKDIYQDQDVDLECAAIKAFAVQALGEFITSPIYSAGALTTITSEGYEKLICDAIQLIGVEEPIETLKQYIALTGISHCGKEFNDDIKKERNLLDHPFFIFSRMKNEISIESPKLKLNLWHNIHESLKPAADFTEASIFRLRATIEILLARFGPQIFLHSSECGQVAEMKILCYAMFSCAARASRSYCIGLRNAEQEVNLTNALCYEFQDRVLKLAKEVDNGEYASTSHYYKKIGEKLMENKKYNLVHPTTRNF